MPSSISFDHFDSEYQTVVAEVFRNWSPAVQSELARHCVSWAPEKFDFRNYLSRSSIRFFKAYGAMLSMPGQPRICDIGGFWGVFPVTLKRLGFDTTMTEALQYYGAGFDALFDFVRKEGVEIVDYDPFSPEANIAGTFDFVSVMAVIEHYPHSLATFLLNMKKLMSPKAHLYIEVPNMAYWPKRLAMLLGESPLADVLDIYHSQVPFIGHHHEYTIGELRRLLKVNDLAIVREDFYNYSSDWPQRSPTVMLRRPVQALAFALLKDSRECLAVTCTSR
jgi:2-polyprenyl-3-methyl-5-hydroxy-6-metoxy-1,4-benzoquinol methylase